MKNTLLFFLWLFGCAPLCLAQALTVEYGAATIPIDQYFTISLKAPATRPTKVEGFPVIEGMQKSTQKSYTTTYTKGTQKSVVYTLTQQYAPLKEGEFTVKPFTLTVDGEAVAVPGFKGKVVPVGPADAVPVDSLLPAAGPMGAPEFIEVKENAFLTLHVPKTKAYVGEAVPVSLWFYVADADLGLLDFYEFEPQILKIVQQLKQRSALEETLQQEEILPGKVKVGDKDFTRFKLYDAVLFPITAQDLRFPAISLRMIKYKIAKNPSLLTQNRQPEYKTYTTQPKAVSINPLPPHPQRDQVPVGVFRLEEQVSRRTISVNQNLIYHLRIEGEGNIKLLPQPQSISVPSELEIYPPETRLHENQSQGRIVGSKTFRYFVVGREPGEYPLRELFQWVFFNPVTARYDTLKPNITLRVRGKEDQNSLIRAHDLGDFYNIADTESNKLIHLAQFKEVRFYTNVVLAVMLGAALFIFILKRK